MAMFDGMETEGLQRLLDNLRDREDIVARGVEVLAPSRRIAAYVAAVVSCAAIGHFAFSQGAYDRHAALEHEQRRLGRELGELRQEQTRAQTIERQHAEIELAVADLRAALFAGAPRFDTAGAVTHIDDLARLSAVAVDRIAVRESSPRGLSIEARGGFGAIAAWVRRLAESELLITYEEFRLSRPVITHPGDRGMLVLTATLVVHRPGDEP